VHFPSPAGGPWPDSTSLIPRPARHPRSWALVWPAGRAGARPSPGAVADDGHAVLPPLARLARRYGRRRLAPLTVIEHDVPDVPDRQIKLADGFPDLPGPGILTHQPQCHVEGQARGEQPAHHDVVQAPGDAVVLL